jgi:hypothetical protein
MVLAGDTIRRGLPMVAYSMCAVPIRSLKALLDLKAAYGSAVVVADQLP